MKAFSLGAVVVPAINGSLFELGFDISALGQKALGSIIEDRPSKALVKFPDINLSTWLKHDELADVVFEAQAGKDEFKKILPDFSSAQNISLCWWLWKLVKDLPVLQIHHFECGKLGELWDDQEGKLSDYSSASPQELVANISLGLTELILEEWEKTKTDLGSKLLFARFLPAGMHRLELSLYLRI